MAIEYVVVEEASFRVAVREAVSHAAEQGRVLEAIGRSLDEAICGVTSDADIDALVDASVLAQGAVVHAHAVLAELGACAGRLTALAGIRAAVCPAE
jgi:hypothetical protein